MSIAGFHLRLKSIEDAFTVSSTSQQSIKLTTEDVEDTVKKVFNTLSFPSDLKITEELKTFTDKMCVLENDLITTKSLISSLSQQVAKKHDSEDLIGKIEKIEKAIEKMNSKQDTIIKRIVVLEKNSDSV